MNSKAASNPVVIVGGGIGGLAAALALSRKGIASQVLEQAPELKEIGAGIQLGPNFFRMFDILGVTDEITRLASFPTNLTMRDSTTGELVTSLPLDQEFLNRFTYPYGLIYRADLHRVFLEACQKSDLIKIDSSQKVVGVEQDDSGVTARSESGAVHRGVALIGADGLWSTMRQEVVGDGAPIVSGHITYRAVLPVADMPKELRWPDMVIWAGEKVHLVQYPMRAGELFNLVAVFHSNRYEEGWNTFGDPAELHERFAGTCEPVRTLLGKIESWRMWVLCDRPPIKTWTKDRITLLGDAAHPMLQYLAQGAAMATEDAVCLADKVVEARGDYPAAFQAYQQERYLRTGRVQIMARVYGEFYHAAGVARELRNQMLGSRTPKEALDSMEWLYGGPPGYAKPKSSASKPIRESVA
jgi:2-polyprenyl-6-methoxyphenol hydroxylase-like FAD-dependent oxidoreductase